MFDVFAGGGGSSTAFVEAGFGFVAAIARSGDQLDRLRPMAPVQHRTDAQETDRGVVVEEVGQKVRPQERIQLIAEVGG